MARLENAVTLESRGNPSELSEEAKGSKVESVRRLVEVMRTHPNASKGEWARMIGFSPGYVSQLLRIIYEKGQT